MKFLSSFILVLAFFTNSFAFAGSQIMKQETMKKNLNGFVLKVSKEKNPQKKRAMISNLISKTVEETAKFAKDDSLSVEEVKAISEFQSMNEDYQLALEHVEDENLNNFAKAYATEYQKALPIVIIYLGVSLFLVWMVMCNVYGVGCVSSI